MELEYYNFKAAVYYSVKEWFKTDMTNYDNWVGIRDFADCIWREAQKDEHIDRDGLNVKKIINIPPPKYLMILPGIYIKRKSKI